MPFADSILAILGCSQNFSFMAILGKVYLKCHMATIDWTKRGIILAIFLNLCLYGNQGQTYAKCLIASKA